MTLYLLTALAGSALLLPTAPPATTATLAAACTTPRVAPSWPRMEAEAATSDVPAGGWGISTVSPNGALVQRVEGKTRKTWKFSDYSKDRVQVAMTSEGRPIHTDVQLWLGPDWTPFKMSAYSEDGKLRPIDTLVATRNKAATIEVRNNAEYEFPFMAAANYADGAMATLATELPASIEGELCQGGALRSYPIAPETESVELVLKTDGRQLNAKIELLNAPNNPKQIYECFTNNGELSSLCVAMKTPEPGTTIRIINRAPVEFPCYIHLKEC